MTNLNRVIITICDPCLNGEGGECHTPGCAFWLHRMDKLPVHSELYKVLRKFPALETAEND